MTNEYLTVIFVCCLFWVIFEGFFDLVIIGNLKKKHERHLEIACMYYLWRYGHKSIDFEFNEIELLALERLADLIEEQYVKDPNA